MNRIGELRSQPLSKRLVVHNPSNTNEDAPLQEEELADAVLEYLAENPRASDTVEGIAEWWIMRQRVRAEVKTLSKVLRRLTKTGRLEKIGEGDRALYHL